MEGLVLTMTVELPQRGGYYNPRMAVMAQVEYCCDGLWIDDQPVDITTRTIIKTDTPVHTFKYSLKPGYDYLPVNAFSSASLGWTIKSIVLPEGLKSLLAYCFYRCHFECDLILPESLEQICAGALNCKIDGVFNMPATLKRIASLPENEEKKDEIILPEGLVEYTPDHIVTQHLHVPSSLRICHSRYGNDFIWGWDVKRITIDENNPHLIIKNNRLVSVKKVKKEVMTRLNEVTRQALIDTAFSTTELEYEVTPTSVLVYLPHKRVLKILLPGKTTAKKATQAADIAEHVKYLLEDLIRRYGSSLIDFSL